MLTKSKEISTYFPRKGYAFVKLIFLYRIIGISKRLKDKGTTTTPSTAPRLLAHDLLN
jgi:hypothetical protein